MCLIHSTCMCFSNLLAKARPNNVLHSSSHLGGQNPKIATAHSLTSGECWCSEWDRHPIQVPISNVSNFLAELHTKGYSYSSLNSCRSNILSVHEKVNGYLIGQHPMITRVLKGAFNQNPHKHIAQATSFSFVHLPRTKIQLIKHGWRSTKSEL